MTMNNLKKAELRRFAELDAAKSRLHEDATASASAEADLEMLKEYCDESDAVVDSLARLLAGVALAVHGPEMPLHRHSYHDLPERVAELVNERNKLAALVEDSAMRRNACSGCGSVGEASKILRTHNAWRRGETDDNPHTPKEIGSAIDEVLADLAGMRAEVEALRKNSNRYQWLRDKSEAIHSFYLSTPIWITGVRFRQEDVDRSIDTAMCSEVGANG